MDAALRALALVLALTSCRASHPARANAIVALRCASEASCVDADGRALTCESARVRTGRSSGLGRRCRPIQCATGECPSRPMLSGEVGTDVDRQRHVLAGVKVSVWPVGGGARVETRSDDRGLYYFLVTAEQTLFVGAEGAPGLLKDLHALTVPATGFHLSLELWRPEELAQVLGPSSGVDVTRGLIAVQFAGVSDATGVGAASVPPAAVSLTFDARGVMVRSDRIVATATRTLALAGMNGPVAITPLDSPTVRCAQLAVGSFRWPVEPGTFTQVDLECAATR